MHMVVSAAMNKFSSLFLFSFFCCVCVHFSIPFSYTFFILLHFCFIFFIEIRVVYYFGTNFVFARVLSFYPCCRIICHTSEKRKRKVYFFINFQIQLFEHETSEEQNKKKIRNKKSKKKKTQDTNIIFGFVLDFSPVYFFLILFFI